MQSTGHSSMQPLSSTSTHGSAITYVTSAPAPRSRLHRGGARRWWSGSGSCDVGETALQYSPRRRVPPGRVAPDDVGDATSGSPPRGRPRGPVAPEQRGGPPRRPLQPRALALVRPEGPDHGHVRERAPPPVAVRAPGELVVQREQ